MIPPWEIMAPLGRPGVPVKHKKARPDNQVGHPHLQIYTIPQIEEEEDFNRKAVAFLEDNDGGLAYRVSSPGA